MQAASTPGRQFVLDRNKRFEPRPAMDDLAHYPGEFVCARCRQTFPCEVIRIFGRETRPNVCEACEPVIAREGRSVRNYQDPGLLAEQWDVFCPPEFRDPANPFSQDMLPQPEKFTAAMKWAYQPRGLLLHGPTQQGKTRIAYEVLRRQHFEHYIKIDGGDSSKWVNECAKRFREGDGERWLESQQRVQLLFLDDLGNEASGERGEGSIFAVIKYRCEHQLPTIITTQKISSDFEQIARNRDRGAALASRLIDHFDAIRF